MTLRVAFAGTPAFAAQALQAVLAAGHVVPLVLTQPDRAAGRGLKLQPSAVKQCALAAGLTVIQPRSLRLDGRHPDDARAASEALRAAAPDVMVVAAYGLLLPAWVLSLPALGCLNIHASLLPRWRGAAPIQRAIEAGDRETGITLMQMDEGLDTGAMLLSAREGIGADDTTGRLHDRLAALGARLVVQALAQVQAGPLPAVPQPVEGVTYARKIEKAEAAIDWRAPAAEIERRVRAFDPAPGCHFGVDAQVVKLWRAEVHPRPVAAVPGEVLDVGSGRWVVACGDGALELLEVQPAGGRRQPAEAFLRGHPMAPGQRLPLAG